LSRPFWEWVFPSAFGVSNWLRLVLVGFRVPTARGNLGRFCHLFQPFFCPGLAALLDVLLRTLLLETSESAFVVTLLLLYLLLEPLDKPSFVGGISFCEISSTVTSSKIHYSTFECV
jgi:hypothetical protein